MFSKILNATPKNQEPIHTNLSSIIDLYDYYFIDIWGVMHNGKEAFPKAVKAVNSLLALGKKVIFLSNMPRPGTLVYASMKEHGVNDGYHVLTSGDLTRKIIAAHHLHKKIFHLGEHVNQDILNGINVNLVKNLEDADIILLTIFLDDEHSYNETLKICKKIADMKIPTICANPDKEAFHGTNVRLTAGHFGKKIEEDDGEVSYIGKPFLDIYQAAFEYFGINPAHEKILMIGDTIETDILGASNASIDSALVFSGVTNKKLEEEHLSVEHYCNNHHLPFPTYTMNQLEL
jgi:HAD superfamily hydrolase (TIGR01459 family)